MKRFWLGGLLLIGAPLGCTTNNENGSTNNTTVNNTTANNTTVNNTTVNNTTVNNTTVNNTTVNNTTVNNNTPDMGTGDMGDPDMAEPSPWTATAHPCAGNRTDALWCDDDQTCFVSCGTTTTGMGLFMTSDGGATWASPTTAPANFFDTARVNTISRSDDGLLYVGGDLPNSAGVVSMAANGTLTEIFTRGNQVGNSFTVGRFRRENGFAIAESLNGTDIIVREMDGGDPTDSWTNVRFWDDGDPDDIPAGVQILDVEVHNGQFWASGSRINQPPIVFTPSWTPGDFDFGIVPLASGLGEFSGELWGLDVNDDGTTVGGVNQDRDAGMIYSIAALMDPNVAGNWTAFDVSTLFPDNVTWVTDVCRGDNNVVYAVGRESAEEWGFVLHSTDGGATFTDITPYDVNGESEFGDVSRCQAFADGVVIAGAGGLFARNF